MHPALNHHRRLILKIGLLGYGTVGRSVATLLQERNLGIEIKSILRRPGKATQPGMTEQIESILADPEIDCVVEVLSGTEPALDYITRAIKAGKHVVSANKAALAANFAGLMNLAREHHVHLLFEASCGGGIPWIENLKKAARLDQIHSASGILNGTSNYILDQMEANSLSFQAALEQAQQLGYAEADPTADIAGFDVRNKALISATLAYGLKSIREDFPVAGIEKLSGEIMQSFLKENKVLRLMMFSRREDHRYALAVVPVVCPAGSLEHAVKRNFNAVRLEGDIVGPLLFVGQGAGGAPTADAIIQDLLSIAGDRVEPVDLTNELTYDASLLSGTGYFGNGQCRQGTLHELIEQAHQDDTFLAFEPNQLE